MYQKFGLEFVDLKEMFAICVIDIRNKKKIFCIRDRFGIKSFYFNCFEKKKKQFSFASEIHQLFKNKNI